MGASWSRIVIHHDALLAQARFEGETFAAQVQRIVADLPRDVYLSFDIDGLDPALKAGADESLRLSDLTLPHAFVRVLLAEALYRAWSLSTGHPYHRE